MSSEIRLDPRTRIFWQKVSEKGSVITITDGSEGRPTRTVSMGTWITWERLAPQTNALADIQTPTEDR